MLARIRNRRHLSCLLVRNSLAILFLFALLVLASCRVDMDITLNGSGGGTIKSTITTDVELIYQQLKAAAERERAKGLIVETGADGPNRFVRVTASFSNIEELNKGDSDLIWSLQQDRPGQFLLSVRGNAKSFPVPIPMSILVHMPGKVIDATAGMNINENTARWEGLYATIAFQGLYIRSEVQRGLLIVLLIIVLTTSLGAVLFLRKRRRLPKQTRLSRYCTKCGNGLAAESKFCHVCGEPAGR